MTPERKDPDLDPAVAAILGDQEQKRVIRKVPKAEAAKLREKRAKEEAERERQAGRHRVTLELDRAVFAALLRAAEAEQVSPASAANWLLAQALLQYARGDLTFEGCKRTTESPRWLYTVDLRQVAGDLDRLAEEGF